MLAYVDHLHAQKRNKLHEREHYKKHDMSSFIWDKYSLKHNILQGLLRFITSTSLMQAIKVALKEQRQDWNLGQWFRHRLKTTFEAGLKTKQIKNKERKNELGRIHT